jgi:hypothetical protein
MAGITKAVFYFGLDHDDAHLLELFFFYHFHILYHYDKRLGTMCSKEMAQKNKAFLVTEIQLITKQ